MKATQIVFFFSILFLLTDCGRIFGGVTWLNGFSIAPTSGSMNPNSQITFSTLGGTAPFTYTIVNGPNHSGRGSISASGVYTSPQNPGVVTIQVTDGSGKSRQATINVGGDRMWTIGGTNSGVGSALSYYSFDGQSWTSPGGGFPAVTSDMAVTVFRDQMISAGGFASAATINTVYSSNDGATWNAIGALAVNIDVGALTVYNDQLYFVGGTLNDFAAGSQKTVYKSTDGGATWNSLGAVLPGFRSGGRIAVYDNKMWYVGGVDTANTGQSSVWSSTDGSTWSVEASLPASESEIGLIVYNDTMFSVAGVTGGGPTNTTNVYSYSGGGWSGVIGNIPSARGSGSAMVLGSTLYWISGLANGGAHKNDVFYSVDVGVSWNTYAAAVPVAAGLSFVGWTNFTPH